MGIRRSIAGALAVVVLALGASGCAQDERRTVTGPFDATVYYGPSTGLAVRGTLELTVDSSGRATGFVTQPDGTRVSAAGQVQGRSIDLAFDLGDRGRLYGSGAAPADITDSDVEFGGPLVGPLPADVGDWKGRGKPGPSILN